MFTSHKFLCVGLGLCSEQAVPPHFSLWRCGVKMLRCAAIGAAFLLFFAFSSAKAEVILAVDNVTVTVGSSSYFDVYIDTSSDVGNYYAAGYMLKLISDGSSSGVSFTGVGTPANSLFPGSTCNIDSISDDVLEINNYLMSGENLITNNAGLVRVYFQTTADSAGIYSVSLVQDPFYPTISDGAGTLLSDKTTVSCQPGTITVTAVPEPGTLCLCIILGLVTGVGLWLKERFFCKKAF